MVIGVGINPVAGIDGRTRLVGDAASAVKERVAALTPVPPRWAALSLMSGCSTTLPAAQLQARIDRAGSTGSAHFS